MIKQEQRVSHVCGVYILKRICSSADVEYGLIFAKSQIFIFSFVCVIISFRESAPQCFHSFDLKFTNAIYFSVEIIRGTERPYEQQKFLLIVSCLLKMSFYSRFFPNKLYLFWNSLSLKYKSPKMNRFQNWYKSAWNGSKRYIIRMKVIGWIYVDKALLGCENESKDKYIEKALAHTRVFFIRVFRENSHLFEKQVLFPLSTFLQCHYYD